MIYFFIPDKSITFVLQSNNNPLILKTIHTSSNPDKIYFAIMVGFDKFQMFDTTDKIFKRTFKPFNK